MGKISVGRDRRSYYTSVGFIGNNAVPAVPAESADLVISDAVAPESVIESPAPVSEPVDVPVPPVQEESSSPVQKKRYVKKKKS